MRVAAKEFADDPCTSTKRATMVRAARALLSSVTRLLCVADMADVYRLLASLKLVSLSFFIVYSLLSNYLTLVYMFQVKLFKPRFILYLLCLLALIIHELGLGNKGNWESM